MPGGNCIERLEDIQTAFVKIFGDTLATLALSEVSA
jgi:hypothetical protein